MSNVEDYFFQSFQLKPTRSVLPFCAMASCWLVPEPGSRYCTLNRLDTAPTSSTAFPAGTVMVTLTVTAGFNVLPASERRLLIDNSSADTSDRVDGPGTLSLSF